MSHSISRTIMKSIELYPATGPRLNIQIRPTTVPWSLVAGVSLALWLSGLPSARAATANLHPVADTTLQEAFPNNNLGDGTSFQTGGRRQGGRTRGLMQFDIAGNVPAGATINSVSLTLTVTAVPSGGFNSIFDLH